MFVKYLVHYVLNLMLDLDIVGRSKYVCTNYLFIYTIITHVDCIMVYRFIQYY